MSISERESVVFSGPVFTIYKRCWDFIEVTGNTCKEKIRHLGISQFLQVGVIKVHGLVSMHSLICSASSACTLRA